MSNMNRKGFTLVELLVVIGIIALLISILLPSLARARESANRIACLSNQKQVYMAMVQYATDNNGWLPVSGYNIRPTRADFDFSTPDNNTGNNKSALGRLYAFGYLGNAPAQQSGYVNGAWIPVLRCQSRADTSFYPAQGASGSNASIQVSYFSFSIRRDPRLWTRFSYILDGNERKMRFDDTKALIHCTIYNPSIVGGTQPNPVHNFEGVNVVYGDGHGMFVQIPKDRMFLTDNNTGSWRIASYIPRWLDNQ